MDNQEDFGHEYMANHYIDIITSALQSIANELNITISDSDLNALAWYGLQGTTKWNEKSTGEKEGMKAIWKQQLQAYECN